MNDLARLLLIDDDPDQLALVTDLLRAVRAPRWQIESAANARDAIQLLTQGAYDAALVDYRLGADTGLDVVKRARELAVRTPLVMLTGIDDRRIDLAAMEAGADDFIPKSGLTTDSLERALRYAVRHAAVRQTLESRESRFRALIQHSSDAILLTDADGRVTFSSDSVHRVMGYVPEDMPGRSIFDGVHEEDLAVLQARFHECVGTPGGQVTVQFRARGADGAWRHHELSAVNGLADPAVRGVVINARNITDRRLAELERDHLASIVESSHDAILSIALTGKLLSWNASAERLYGYTASEVVGQPAAMLIGPESRDEFQWMLTQVALGESVNATEMRWVRNGGSAAHVSLSMSPLVGVGGAIIGASSVARDITAEVNARRALVNHEREYRSLFEESPVGIAKAGLDGRWMDLNSQFCKILGYSRAELVNAPVIEITHPADRKETVERYRSLLEGGTLSYDAETRCRSKDGSYVWVSVRVSSYQDTAGDLQYFIVAIADISHRRQIEEDLRQSVAHLTAILAHLPLSIWALDRAGIITLSEGRLLSRFGSKPGELVGRSQLELYPDHPEITAVTRRALAGESVHHTTRLGDAVFEAWYSPLYDQDGRLSGTVGVSLEITERLQLEAQFQQAQKMEAVGLLAGGVAHDFNNILTAILGFSELAIDDLAEGELHHYELTQIIRAAQSAGALTRQLLAFSRRQVLQPKVFDLNTAIRSMHGLLSRVIGEDIRLDTELQATHNVRADPGQMEQIVLNLAVNARDAMPDGGRLLLRTTDFDVDPGFVATHRGSSLGPHVRVDVTDSGIGMSEKIRARVFEPFFTTKERSRGTGLGLATVYGIVKQSGGSIWVESQEGAGTTFMLLFPVAEGPVETAHPAPSAGQARGHETILVVEDQAEVRTIARLILERQGYTVLEASSPSEAMALVADGSVPDLLFTDVVMPEMNGRQLAGVLKQTNPNLKILFTSGYTDDAIVHHGVLDTDVAFIGKPYTARVLLTRIREVLG